MNANHLKAAGKSKHHHARGPRRAGLRRAGAGLTMALSLVMMMGADGGGCIPNPDPRPICKFDGGDQARLLNSTYAVSLIIQPNPAENKVAAVFFGTAFAIEPHLLATNAHITEGMKTMVECPARIVKVVAVQHGTGKVLEVLQSFTHPDYRGTQSPDVGLLTTKEAMAATVELASDEEAAAMSQTDDIFVTGFPGDVDEIFPVIPTLTIPQATMLSGKITSLRNFDPQKPVTPGSVDIWQHDAGTTPGTSGSSIVRCGKVVGLNNAGTVKLVLTPQQDGSVSIDRIPVASNGFGIHVKHLRNLMGMFHSMAIAGSAMPPQCVQPQQTNNGGGGQQQGIAAFAGDYGAEMTQPAEYAHIFVIRVFPDGHVEGASQWSETAIFDLIGQIDAAGRLYLEDNGEDFGFNKGIYRGQIDVASGQMSGNYSEAGQQIGNWAGERL